MSDEYTREDLGQDTEFARDRWEARTGKDGSFDRWLAEVRRQAAEEALLKAAEEFRVNTWIDLLKPAGGMPGLMRNASAVTDWLRSRAAEYKKAEE